MAPNVLSNFVSRSVKLEMRGRLEGIVIASQRKRHAENRQQLAAGGVVDVGDVPGQSIGIDERGEGNRFLGFLIHHHGHADAAIRVAAAAQLAPGGLGAVAQIAPIGEGGDERNREPIARRLAESGLAF